MEAVAFMESLLRSGENILLFPEGTRSRDGSLLPGKPGVGGLVLDTRAPVVPVFLGGLDRVFRQYLWRDQFSI